MAGCCWRPIAQQQSALRADGNPVPHRNQAGIVELRGYEGEIERYDGPNKAATVYVVGWGTEHERAFPSHEARAAVVYRNETDRSLSIDQIQAGNLCALAVEELWA